MLAISRVPRCAREKYRRLDVQRNGARSTSTDSIVTVFHAKFLISKKGIYMVTGNVSFSDLTYISKHFLISSLFDSFFGEKCFLVKRCLKLCLKLSFAECSGFYIRISYFYIVINRDDSLFKYKKETVHGLSILSIPDSAYDLPFVLTKRNLYRVNDMQPSTKRKFSIRTVSVRRWKIFLTQSCNRHGFANFSSLTFNRVNRVKHGKSRALVAN